MVIPGGRGIAESAARPKHCRFCSKEHLQSHSDFWQCGGCNVVHYCDKVCQRKHWGEHKVLCNALRTLAQNSPHTRSNRFVSHLTPKQASKIVNLVGKRCTINCYLNGQQTEVLWDTGAQVSIVSEHFLKQKFPETNLRNISELIDCELNVTAANGFFLSYKNKFLKRKIKIHFLVNTRSEERHGVTESSLQVPLTISFFIYKVQSRYSC